MEKLLLLLVLSFSSVSFAAPTDGYTPDFTCMNEFPTTAFYSKPIKNADGDELVEFKVVHSFGAANAPIHDGVITAGDFPYLKSKAEVIQKLGDNFTVKFKKSRCEKNGKDLFSCSESNETEINGVKVQGYNFLSKAVETKVYEYTFKSKTVVFSFIYNNMNYDMPVTFQEGECNFRN